MKNLTLEQRVARLEKALTIEKKNKSFESDLDVAGAKAAADLIADKFCKMIGVSGATQNNQVREIIESPMYGWLTIKDYDEIEEDPDARFVFQYSLNETKGYKGYRIFVYPSDNAVNLVNKDGYSIDTGGWPFTSKSEVVSYPLSQWRGFKLSMIDEEDYDDDMSIPKDYKTKKQVINDFIDERVKGYRKKGYKVITQASESNDSVTKVVLRKGDDCRTMSVNDYLNRSGKHELHCIHWYDDLDELYDSEFYSEVWVESKDQPNKFNLQFVDEDYYKYIKEYKIGKQFCAMDKTVKDLRDKNRMK